MTVEFSIQRFTGETLLAELLQPGQFSMTDCLQQLLGRFPYILPVNQEREKYGTWVPYKVLD